MSAYHSIKCRMFMLSRVVKSIVIKCVNCDDFSGHFEIALVFVIKTIIVFQDYYQPNSSKLISNLEVKTT